MPILYFHSKNGNAVTLDHDGTAVASLNAARAEGILTFADILREDNQEPLLAGKPLRLWITDKPDDAGKTLFSLRATATGGSDI
jgi:hypothetical protein